jgi:hypothetical protein
MQSIHPLHPSHILISLITATEMTERVYRASIDDIHNPPPRPLSLVFDIDGSLFYKFEVLKPFLYLFQNMFFRLVWARENDHRQWKEEVKETRTRARDRPLITKPML